MLEQKQTQGMRWRKLTLPLSLSVVGTLLLLYVFSTHVATESGIFSLFYPSGAAARQATPSNEDSACQSANSLVKDTGSMSSPMGLINPLCTCDLSIESIPSQETVPPGSSARYKLIVKNIGQCNGALTLAATSQREWQVEIVPSPPIDLPRNKHEVVSLYHTVPAHTPGGTVDMVTVTGTLYCESPCGGPDVEVITLTTTVEIIRAVALAPDRTASAVAGETVHLTHTLANTGQLADTFRFEAIPTLEWPVALPTPVSLEPNDPAVITVSVSVPLSASRGDENTIVVKAVSTNDASVSDSVTDRVKVLKSDCDVALSIDKPNQSAAPGESVTYTLTVSNTGVYTGGVEMKVDTPAGWPFNVTSPPTMTTLPPDGFADWLLSLTVPLYEEPDDKTSYVTAELHCTEISQTSEVSRNVTTTILAVPVADIEPGVVKTILVTQDIFDNGTVVSFTHAVTNVGNIADIFNFTVHSDREWTVEEPESLVLEPFVPKAVTFSVAVPPHVQFISDTLTITATPQSAPNNYDTAVDWIKDGRVFLPVVFHGGCPVQPLCNSDFETGSLSPCWQAGGEVTISSCPWGGRCALLGRSDPAYGCYSVPINTAWLEQTFSTPGGPPNDGHPRLSFRYEINTREHRGNDSFEVYLYAHDTKYPILKRECKGYKVGCINPPTVIHRRCEIDLSNPTDCDGNPINADFLCTDVTLRFENHNGVDNWYNTWTYVSEIEFNW